MTLHSTAALTRRQFERYGQAELQMTTKHSEYLAALRESEEISCLLDTPAALQRA